MKLVDLYHLNKNQIAKLIRTSFHGEGWVPVFLNDTHHGLTHGNQVRMGSLKLINKLLPDEKRKLLTEGKIISQKNYFKNAVALVEIISTLHDCGRFNYNGVIIESEQIKHQNRSADRINKLFKTHAIKLCKKLINDATLSHDFQNRIQTPHLKPPKTIVGKIVQSSDQLGWFHPRSIYRTLDYTKLLGIPFYNPKTRLLQRLRWSQGKRSPDTLTVLMAQLFGTANKKRFGIEAARKKVRIYTKSLKSNIVELAKNHGAEKETKKIIEEVEKYYHKHPYI